MPIKAVALEVLGTNRTHIVTKSAAHINDSAWLLVVKKGRQRSGKPWVMVVKFRTRTPKPSSCGTYKIWDLPAGHVFEQSEPRLAILLHGCWAVLAREST
eukprot:CAMPEP_0171114758 /NCGR_PEP_ID=MMETSP0766_2-20121228/86063_1 /TAXON_ID=439317 /ORGANISM="Gambierdiscus australes, Strain CAWD 149" /LENGTH=99 /DNA_ID=CAMNT_0011577061 /DNA_START=623 /DNA_END=918 /DNA_ORIENTATION=+